MNFFKEFLKSIYYNFKGHLTKIFKHFKENLSNFFKKFFNFIISSIRLQLKKLKNDISKKNYISKENYTKFFNIILPYLKNFLKNEIIIIYYYNKYFSKEGIELLKKKYNSLLDELYRWYLYCLLLELKFSTKCSKLIFAFKNSKLFIKLKKFLTLTKNSKYLSPALNIYYPIKFALKSINIRLTGLILIFFIGLGIIIHLITIHSLWIYYYYTFLILCFYRAFSIHQKQTVQHLKLFPKLILIIRLKMFFFLKKTFFFFFITKRIILIFYKEIQIINLCFKINILKIKIILYIYYNLYSYIIKKNFYLWENRVFFFLIKRGWPTPIDIIRRCILKIRIFFSNQKYKYADIITILLILYLILEFNLKLYVLKYIITLIISYFS